MAIYFYNGVILFDSGDIAFDEACCCDGGNICDPDPEMLVTVTGATGTINWCGETWNLPADSGVQKIVCPTAYITLVPTAGSLVAQNKWEYGGSTGIFMSRFYNNFGGSSYTAANFLTIRTPSSQPADNFSWFGFTFNPPPGIVYSKQDMSILTIAGPAWPTYSNYLITNDFFGSHVIGGITYAWAKGQGWP